MTGWDRNQAPTPLSLVAVLQTVGRESQSSMWKKPEPWRQTHPPKSFCWHFFTTAIFSSWLPPFHIKWRRVTISHRKGISFFFLLHSKLQLPTLSFSPVFSLLGGGCLSSRATQSNYRSIKGFLDQSFCQQSSHSRLRGFYRVRVNEISFHVEISWEKALKKRIWRKGSPVFLLVCQSLHPW